MIQYPDSQLLILMYVKTNCSLLAKLTGTHQMNRKNVQIRITSIGLYGQSWFKISGNWLIFIAAVKTGENKLIVDGCGYSCSRTQKPGQRIKLSQKYLSIENVGHTLWVVHPLALYICMVPDFYTVCSIAGTTVAYLHCFNSFCSNQATKPLGFPEQIQSLLVLDTKNNTAEECEQSAALAKRYIHRSP